LGDSTLVTVKVGKHLVAVKADKNTKVHMGENVGVRFDPKQLHFFDTTSGTRVAFDASR
ncbi:TOBE domain-containing protein, partial [Mesorhizobium tamadayense]